jgi:hypothetical protein
MTTCEIHKTASAEGTEPQPGKGVRWERDGQKMGRKKTRRNKNYGTRDSRMVTHCSTNLAIPCLTRAERTGSRVFMVL